MISSIEWRIKHAHFTCIEEDIILISKDVNE